MAAITLMLLSLLKSGDHVVYSQSMFGSTLKLIGSEFARFGVASTVVSQTDLAEWKAAIRPNTQILFAEGALVAKDTPLFEIDPRKYEAEVATAQAALDSAQAQHKLADQDLRRAEKLVEEKVVAVRTLDAARNGAKVAKAALNGAEAQMRQAKLNLEYAHVKAPIAGRVGRPELTVGNLVQSGSNAPVLTTIVATDRLYAEFDVDEGTYITHILPALNSGVAPQDIPVRLILGQQNWEGHIQSFDNQLNTASGSIRARAIFDNNSGALIPGMFAEVQLGSGVEQEGMMVPERAIGTDQNKKFVYVVNAEQKIDYRPVQLGDAQEGKRFVTDGLKEGERVVINGLQKIRPGVPVTATEVTTSAQ
jgi:multidrug efflux system membrane fusion protein